MRSVYTFILMSDTGCLKIEAQVLFERFGVENVSQKYISITDVKLLSYTSLSHKRVLSRLIVQVTGYSQL